MLDIQYNNSIAFVCETLPRVVAMLTKRPEMLQVMNIEMSREVERPVVRLGQCESLMVMNKEKCFAEFVPQHIVEPS